MGLGSEYPERFTYGNRRTERRGQVYPFKNYTEPACPRFRADPFSIDGETDAKKARRKIAYVPQNGSVNWDFPATVKDIVLMGRYGHIGWCRTPSQGDRLIAEEMIARVGMDGYEDRQINELSGGQQQRVFLARALAQEASVYLLDEPFKGVDMQTEKSSSAF